MSYSQFGILWKMPLHFRLAAPSEYAALEEMVIESFEPITWFKRTDEQFGPLNGMTWRDRWQVRLAAVFKTQIVLVGELDHQIAAVATGTVDTPTRLGYIDLLAVGQCFQGKGYGREMLRGMLQHLKNEGAAYVHLECLTTNEVGNELYRSEGFQEVARSIRWFMKLPD